MNAQNQKRIAFYDAVKLAEYRLVDSIPLQDSKIAGLLESYFPERYTIDSIATAVKENQFLDKYFMNASGVQNIDIDIDENLNVGKDILGIDVTTITQGISQFLIDRAKAELSAAFFDRFKKFADENLEFRVLFPSTTSNLDKLLAFHYSEMLPTLRKGFLEDIKRITYRLDDLLELDRYRILLKDYPEIKLIIRSIRIIHMIESENSNPASILAEFSKLDEWIDKKLSKEYKNVGATLKTANLISENLRYKDSTRTWVTITEVNELLNDKVAFDIFLGLLYQLDVKDKNHQIQFYIEENYINKFSDLLEDNKDDLFFFKNQLLEFIEIGERLERSKTEIQQKLSDNTKLTKTDYYNYINETINIIDQSFDFVKVFNIEIPKSEEYLKIAKTGNSLFKNIYSENYSQAIVNTTDILNGIVEVTEEKKIDNILEAKDSLVELLATNNTLEAKKIKNKLEVINEKFSESRAKGRLKKVKEIKKTTKDFNNISLAGHEKYLTVIDNTFSKDDTASKNLRKLEKFASKTTKYGLFMANMIEAETPEDVKTILESTVLPVGSSAIKKNSRFNISVQSYLGLSYLINAEDDNLDVPTAWKDDWSLVAPIGISFSTGFGKWGSASVFVSLLDVGAIVDFDLQLDTMTINDMGNTETILKKDYKIELGQIIAPGGHFVYGLPFNLPLALGIGWQYGPGLGKVSENGITIRNPAWRFNAFLSVDIPLFTVVNNRRDYKKRKRK